MRGDQALEIRATAIPDVIVLRPRVVQDERGAFCETFQARRFAEATGHSPDFVQDNQSLSREKGVVRGLHFQIDPAAQGKLIRVLRGAILDIAVDIRRGSPTFGRHVAEILSETNYAQVWVPIGFAHGFCTLETDTVVAYKTTAYYDPACDKGLKWNDPALGIEWPVGEGNAVLSPKDRGQPGLAELPPYFS